MRPRCASGAPVSGDVFLPRENQSSIDFRSYVLPSAAITGQSISSIDIGQHRLSGWSPPEVAAAAPLAVADAEAAATILLASSAETPCQLARACLLVSYRPLASQPRQGQLQIRGSFLHESHT